MRLKEFLEKQAEQLGYSAEYTLIIRRTISNEGEFPRTMYETTACHTISDWLFGGVDEYIVIEQDQPPIDSNYLQWYLKGRVSCCIVTTEQDIIAFYGEKEGKKRIEQYENGKSESDNPDDVADVLHILRKRSCWGVFRNDEFDDEIWY